MSDLVSTLGNMGWPGAVLLAVATVFVPWLINQLNKRKDLKQGEADAGKTATDLATQAKDAQDDLESLRRSDPPS